MSEPVKHLPECDGSGAVACWLCVGSCGSCGCMDDCIHHTDALECPNWVACSECAGDGSIRCPACADDFACADDDCNGDPATRNGSDGTDTYHG